MANVPIVTEVTKAQLDALVAANELNEGLQYKVTDINIDWLLIANSVNTLKAATGTLYLINGIILPDYITTDILIIDTDSIIQDIEDPGLTIYVPQDYIFYKFIASVIGVGIEQILFMVNGVGFHKVIPADGVGLYVSINSYNTDGNDHVLFTTSKISGPYLIKGTGNTAPGFRVLLYFYKSPF